MPPDDKPGNKKIFSSSGKRLFLLVVIFIVMANVIIPILARPSIGHYRKVVLKQVQIAGGWAVLNRECESLLTNYPPNNLYSFRPRGQRMFVSEYSNAVVVRTYKTNNLIPLPPGLETLQPLEIQFQMFTNTPTVVRIKLFGSGKTDWTPYYGLWFVYGAISPDYTPSFPNGSRKVTTKITDSIFEVHDKM
jgi:hypothetical protein